MTRKEEAALFDAQDNPIKAIEAYEGLLATSEADLEEILNLVLLYFECWDEGYAAYHHLPGELVGKAMPRILELLEMAERRYGERTEIEFWRLFIAWIYLGGPEFFERCKELVEREFSLVPYFYLFGWGSPEGEQYWPQANQLHELVKDGKTAKARYIRSYLESAMNMRNQSKDR